ncbi:GNAT family N-acetyltransferase, partial [Vibrio cincinnatiensis]|uniref:GNAT family N-acetyltransferase n=1 Tax=Vibrio cincinnatiensis TaxID=675 RepID=UPI001FA95BD9
FLLVMLHLVSDCTHLTRCPKLLVRIKHRSKGYGAKLMHALKMEAKSSLTSHISWTASPYNVRAHEFYKKLGAAVERMDGLRPYFNWAMYG